jgi:hypothetical protein
MSRRVRQPPQKPREDHPDQLLFFDPGKPSERQASDDEIREWIDTLIERVMRSQHRGCSPRICNYSWEDFSEEVWLGAFKRCSGKYVHHKGPLKIWDFVGGAIYYSLRDVQKKSVQENGKYDPDADRPLLNE